jgi:hypothetical protein
MMAGVRVAAAPGRAMEMQPAPSVQEPMLAATCLPQFAVLVDALSGVIFHFFNVVNNAATH